MKRCFDVFSALSLLVALSPLLLVLIVMQVIFMGFPVFFVQDRAGKGGRVFRMVKFRTMRVGEGSEDDRVTTWGMFMRRFSLDELPELINILRGDMSLVGPRPLLMEYNDRYSARQKLRLEVIPGITGWAQIHGRNALDWSTRFELDVWYVENGTFWVDLMILLRTLVVVLRRRGVTHGDSVTIAKFGK